MDKFADVLQGVLDKLGIAAVYLWPKAVLYTVAGAVTDIIGAIAICVFLLFMAKKLHVRAEERDKNRNLDDETTGVVRFLSWTLCFLGPLILILAVSCTTPRLISPEYATVRDLISAGAPKK